MIDVYLGGTIVLPSDALNVGNDTFSVDATVRSRRTATLSLVHRSNAASPAAGQEVKIYADGGKHIFSGYIDSAPRVVDEVSQRIHAITCRDYSSLADLRSTGERVYLNAKLNDIFRDLVASCLGGDGVGVANVPSGGGPTVEKLELDYASVAEAFDSLCRSYGYEWEIDVDKELRVYQPTAGASLGTINNTTPGIIAGSVSGREVLSSYANKIVVILSRVLTDAQTETFNSSHPDQPTDGSRKDWTLAYPVNSAPTITVNGTAKTVGLDGVDVGKDWYWQASSAVVRQDNAAAALTSSDALVIKYIGERTQQFFADDGVEIAVRAALEARSGIYEKIIRSSTPVASADAQQYANNLLAELKQVPYEIEFGAFGSTYEPGQKWTLGFGGHPSGDYIITRVQWQADSSSFRAGANIERQRVFASKGVITRDIYESWKQAFSGGGVSVSGGGSLSGGSGSTASPWVTIAYASTITPSLTAGTNHQCTLTGNVTLAVPSGGTDGQRFSVWLEQDATGYRTISFASGYKQAVSLAEQPPSTAVLIDAIMVGTSAARVISIQQGIPA